MRPTSSHLRRRWEGPVGPIKCNGVMHIYICQASGEYASQGGALCTDSGSLCWGVWLRPTLHLHSNKLASRGLPSESGTRFATSAARAYTLTMRLSRRGLGSSRCESDSKTWRSAALTSGLSGCPKPSPPSSQAAEPGCSNARSQREHPLSRARS